MPRNWRSRTLGIVGIGALIVGAGVVVAAPAGAAPVADAAALRAAVTSLNNAGPAAEIELSPGVTYKLGSEGCKDEDGNIYGDLDIVRTNPLKIFTPDGQPPAVIEMSCDPDTPQRIIHVVTPDSGAKPGKLTVRNIIIRNGHAPSRGSGPDHSDGGGVLSGGDVAIENAKFESNSAGDGRPGTDNDPAGESGGAGGAVFARGSVTIDHSTFTSNKAGSGGSGKGDNEGNCNGGLGGDGGAVLAGGGLTITNSTFSGNVAGNGGNGGDSVEVQCRDDNRNPSGHGGLGGLGGAVACGMIDTQSQRSFFCSGAMVIRGSTLDGNAAGNGGNGGKTQNLKGAGGKGGPGGIGGAALLLGTKTSDGFSLLTVENSTIDGNSSGNGGKGGDGPTAGNGGDGGRAGAIFAFTARGGQEVPATEALKLVHATITENGGGGKAGAAGTVTSPPDASLAAAVAPAQKGDEGGGSIFVPENPWSSLSSVVGVSSPPPNIPDCWTKSTGSQFSVTTVADGDGNGCRFGSGSVKPFADFGLGTLSDNGGPTKTRLPGATGALVDKAVGVTGQLIVDQRGVVRPQAGGADIGAVELQLIDLAVTKSASETSVVAGTEVTFTITVKNTGTSSPQPGVVIADPNCTGLTQATGDTNANNTLDAGELFAYTCTATPTEVGTFTNTASATVTDGAGVKITRTASVYVTVTAAAGGNSPDLASTGVNDPTPELIIGAWLIAGGLVLLLLARPRRMKVRANLE